MIDHIDAVLMRVSEGEVERACKAGTCKGMFFFFAEVLRVLTTVLVNQLIKAGDLVITRALPGSSAFVSLFFFLEVLQLIFF
jgi:hypothetical protein